MAGAHAELMRVAIVNRFYPPDPAPTGVSAYELAEHLARTPGISVEVYATRARYSGPRRSEVQHSARVHRLRTPYAGTQKLLRLGVSLYDGARLALAATRNADVVISLTDPPLLDLWMGFARRRRRFRWVEWTMDVYPEAFTTAGLSSTGNPVYRTLMRAARRTLPERYITLGPRQHAFLSRVRGERPAFVIPCGISSAEPGPEPDWRVEHKDRIVAAYAGNLGEAHPDQVLVDLVRRADKERFRFLLALYGAKAQRVKEALRAEPHVIWRDGVSHGDLAHADVHLASLTREWTHVCVPSKAVSSVCLGRPILYAGAADGDNWHLLQRAGWLIPEQPDGSYLVEDIDRALRAAADPTEREARRREALALRAEFLTLKNRVHEEIAQWIRAVAEG